MPHSAGIAFWTSMKKQASFGKTIGEPYITTTPHSPFRHPYSSMVSSTSIGKASRQLGTRISSAANTSTTQRTKTALCQPSPPRTSTSPIPYPAIVGQVCEKSSLAPPSRTSSMPVMQRTVGSIAPSATNTDTPTRTVTIRLVSSLQQGSQQWEA